MDFPLWPVSALTRRGVLAVLVAAIALAVAALAPSPASALPEDYSLNSESASLSNPQAAKHADFETKFMISGDPTRDLFEQRQILPWAHIRDLSMELPPGLVGNPAAFPHCSAAVFVQQMNGPLGGEHPPQCPTDSQIGIIKPGVFGLIATGEYSTPLYNLEAPGGDSGIVARLGFIGVLYPQFIDVRLDPQRGNALTATIVNLPAINAVLGSFNTLWGVPTDHSHDTERFNAWEALECVGPCHGPVESGLEPTPFMINPTSCGPTEVGMASRSYQREEGSYFSISPLEEVTDCDQVPFQPTLSLQPTTRSAAASGGVDLGLTIPQDGLADPNGLGSSHLKKAVVTLPEGISLNASAADGLGSCSQEQIGVERDERQVVAIQSTGAPVALSFDGQSTNELPQLASAGEAQTALEALPNVAAGDVTVTGRRGGPWTVEFHGAFAGKDVPEIGGVHSEMVRVAIKADGGTYTLSFDGDTTDPIPYDADAAAVQAALEGLAGIETGEIEVSREPGAGEESSLLFRIVFTGDLQASDVASITATSSLTGNYASNFSEGPFARTYQLTQGGQPVQTHTVKQGGALSFDGAPARCPESSKVGTGVINTPVLSEPLKASLYVARQGDNPFNSLLAGYMVAEGAGARIKVAGKFDLNPNTGQIVGTFDNNPQQPFSELSLHFKGGNRGIITTPEQCGTYSTKYELVPWSGNPPVVETSDFTLDENCGAKPFAPGFSAGSGNPLAGAFTSFNVKVTRDAGSPRLSGIAVNPPPGLTGRLAGIPYCPESALASVPTELGTGARQLTAPACPVASQLGTATAGAGSGSPFYLNTSKVYLAGPYKGAPISMAILTPAVAGPFDLGNVLVRTPIYVDPVTAQIHAVSDPLPTMLAGIPLDLREVRVNLDRQGFALNPTSCEPMAATGTISATGGQSAQVSDRFQVGECASLGFKPRLKLLLKGGTTRGKHPALTAILRPRPGDANISRISVSFPSAEFLDQSHIGTVCTRVQWAADQCPPASIYGKVTATTPLLDNPLSGNVYLRSSDHELPDLVTDLRGPATQPIRFEAAGRNDTVNGGLRNTFEFVPDAPISRVVLKMRGGKKGLLQNSRNLCAETYQAKASFAAHNGRTYQSTPALKTSCKGTKGRKGKGGKGRG